MNRKFQILNLSQGFTGIELLVVVVILGILGGGTTVLANQARPGDRLFPLDRVTERVRLVMTLDPIRRQDLRVEFAEERLNEVESLGQSFGEDSKRVIRGLEVSQQAVTDAASHIGEIEQAAETQRASDALARVQTILRNLSQVTIRHAGEIRRIETKVTDAETKAKIEMMSGEVIKIEEKLGRGKQRLEVRIRQNDLEVFHSPIISPQPTEEEGEDEDEEADENEEADEEGEVRISPAPEITTVPTLAFPTSQPTPISEPTKTPTPTLVLSPTSRPTEHEPKTYKVEWEDGRFDPQTLTIKVFDRVEWEDKEEELVRISSDPHPAHTNLPGFDSTSLSKGQKYTFTFSQVGSWGYHNHLSPSSTATVVVSQ